MKRDGEYRVGVGASSMLMIFVVLTMATLGVLAFMSARSELGLAERSVSMCEGYYQAASSAQEAIMALDERLAAGETLDEEFTLYFDAGYGRQLAVSLRTEGGKLTVTRHALEATDEWSEGSLNLFS